MSGIAHQAHDRAHVDDATAALAHKGLGERTRRVERALQIDIEHAIERIVAHAHKQAITGDAGVVDERPNGTEVAEDRFHARIDGIGVGHVALICARRGAGHFAGLARLACGIDAAGVDDGDIVAILRQAHGTSATNAARAARDQRHAARTVALERAIAYIAHVIPFG